METACSAGESGPAQEGQEHDATRERREEEEEAAAAAAELSAVDGNGWGDVTRHVRGHAQGAGRHHAQAPGARKLSAGHGERRRAGAGGEACMPPTAGGGGGGGGGEGGGGGATKLAHRRRSSLQLSRGRVLFLDQGDGCLESCSLSCKSSARVLCLGEEGLKALRRISGRFNPALFAMDTIVLPSCPADGSSSISSIWSEALCSPAPALDPQEMSSSSFSSSSSMSRAMAKYGIPLCMQEAIEGEQGAGSRDGGQEEEDLRFQDALEFMRSVGETSSRAAAIRASFKRSLLSRPSSSSSSSSSAASSPAKLFGHAGSRLQEQARLFSGQLAHV
eukprot:747296-Hanusia_phi.AAC.1